MKTSDMIRQLCEQMNISVSELARRLGQSPQIHQYWGSGNIYYLLYCYI